jgi:hypothetical protein
MAESCPPGDRISADWCRPFPALQDFQYTGCKTDFFSMTLLPLDDPKWKEYRGGYNRAVNDLVPFLAKLQSLDMSEEDWNILWDDLHHQGDVGEASYAVVPYLAEYAKSASQIAWHAFGFAAVVELERTEHDNPRFVFFFNQRATKDRVRTWRRCMGQVLLRACHGLPCSQLGAS